jgi:hypothetical protein
MSFDLPGGVVFFVWTAALGKILTLDNLRKNECCGGGVLLHVQEEWRVY